MQLLDIFQLLLLLGVTIEITISAIGWKICAIAAVIKKHKSIIKKKKHCKIVLLAKSKLNSTDVLISTTSIDSNISHDGLVLINHVLKKYEMKDMKEEIKNWKT